MKFFLFTCISLFHDVISLLQTACVFQGEAVCKYGPDLALGKSTKLEGIGMNLGPKILWIQAWIKILVKTWNQLPFYYREIPTHFGLLCWKAIQQSQLHKP